jgi:hypothetical protein
VRLAYAARTGSDHAGLGLAVLAVGLAAAWTRRRGPGGGRSGGPAGEQPPAASRWAWLPSALPLALVVGVAALRLVPEPSDAAALDALDTRASRAFGEERWEDAAEYARHAVALLPPADPRRDGLLCVRGEALLRAGHVREAVEPFELVVGGASGAHRPQALHSGALAREAAGDPEGASAWRRQLREEYPDTPWAHRLEPPVDPPPSP